MLDGPARPDFRSRSITVASSQLIYAHSPEQAFCLPSWDVLFPSRLVGALSSSPPRKSIYSTPMQPLPSNSRFSQVLARSTERRSSRADHTSGRKSRRRRRFCHVPHTAYEGVKHELVAKQK